MAKGLLYQAVGACGLGDSNVPLLEKGVVVLGDDAFILGVGGSIM